MISFYVSSRVLWLKMLGVSSALITFPEVSGKVRHLWRGSSAMLTCSYFPSKQFRLGYGPTTLQNSILKLLQKEKKQENWSIWWRNPAESVSDRVKDRVKLQEAMKIREVLSKLNLLHQSCPLNTKHSSSTGNQTNDTYQTMIISNYLPTGLRALVHR